MAISLKRHWMAVGLFGLALGCFSISLSTLPFAEAQVLTPKERAKQENKAEKERVKIRATWDDHKISQLIGSFQNEATKVKGECNTDCVATYRCTASAVSNIISYPQYDAYFIHPMRPEDLSSHERQESIELRNVMNTILKDCAQQVSLGTHRTGTIAGLEFQITQVSSMQADPKQWVEFHRNDSAISQYDPTRLETKFGKSKAILKDVWLRQFTTNLNGNYSVSHNLYDCSNKTIQIQQYVVYTPFGTEVFGDYIPSKSIPMDVNTKKSEDYALYNRLCPAPPEPEKKH